MLAMQIYEEIGGNKKFETKTSDMLQSCQSAIDFSDMENVDYSDSDLDNGGDGKVLPSEFTMIGGSGDDAAVTVVSETSWNYPSDETEDLIVDNLKGASFRRQELEGTYFNPSTVFGYWKNVKAFTSAYLPKWYANHHSYFDLQFPKSSFKQNIVLCNAIGSVSNPCRTQLFDSTVLASFCWSQGCSFSWTDIRRFTIFCRFSNKVQMSMPFQKLAQEHNFTCSKLKSKAATLDLDRYISMSYPNYIGVIAFFLDGSDGGVIPQGKNSQ